MLLQALTLKFETIMSISGYLALAYVAWIIVKSKVLDKINSKNKELLSVTENVNVQNEKKIAELQLAVSAITIELTTVRELNRQLNEQVDKLREQLTQTKSYLIEVEEALDRARLKIRELAPKV